MTRGSLFAVVCIVSFAALGLMACGGGEGRSESAEAAETVEPIVIGPEAEGRLAMADAADGSEDHVVSKCVGCGLHMAGDPRHSLEVDGYELQFCSETCRDGFLMDPTGALLALDLPESEEPETP